VNRLDALMLVLKTCKAETCRNPWGVLHPAGDVRSLADALDATFDTFYQRENKVHFDECLGGYLLDNEYPIDTIPYSN
jgi:N-acetylglucosamine-6-sulfatase